ncbi:MAG: hypothetical protein HY537_11540 [Deltaproteobacteria bacterium]|nr:hypothetical protein [Deltaproteobacteria bacterium]
MACIKWSTPLMIVSLVFVTRTACGTPIKWNDQAKWERAVKNVLDFFDDHAWDSHSYASELDEKGNLTSDVRQIVALARMIYANAKAPKQHQNLHRARQTAEFLLRNMLTKDEVGILFRSSVNAKGEAPTGMDARSYVFIFEQAYPIAGLVALYSADPKANADLLSTIRHAAESFWNRFWDSTHGGLFYYYNLSKKDHSNDQGQVHKSYQSTIYPISSFLLALRNADVEVRSRYDHWINKLLDVAMAQLIEKEDGQMTGWLRERTLPDFSIDPSYVMSEAGHITQLSWVMGEAVKQQIVKEPAKRALYRKTVETLLTKFIRHGGISPTLGCVYDAFDRTSGLPLRDDKGRTTTAWWSNLEAIIAYSFALRHRWLGDLTTAEVERTLDGLANCYFSYFVDTKYGGEYFRINAQTGAVVDSTKGNGGKSGYHITEAYQALFGSLAM